MEPRGGVDPHDPETAELTLTHLAITISKFKGTIYRFGGCPEELAPTTPVSLGHIQDFFATLA
jgi:hypothetical protein